MADHALLGQPAPDIDLPGTEGRFRLSDHRGERVVLLFYPGDETAVCTKQFCSYAARPDDMSALNAVVVGISPQDVASHQSFTANHSLNVPLLADTEKTVGKAYGVVAPVVGMRRAVFIVDEEGIVRYASVHALGLRFQSVDDIAAALATLAPPTLTS
jgi:thioredoxin-dependent peroxiredoxin